MAKILVTGGDGFIGHHIVKKYLDLGHIVDVLDNHQHQNQAGIIRKYDKNVREFHGIDLNSNLNPIFIRGKYDVVSHHAAHVDIRKSVQNPEEDAHTNVMGTINLLQYCARHNVKGIIYASSGGAIYGECTNVNERGLPEPLSPYGCSKLAAEHYVRTHANLTNTKAVVLRYANVYGPGQDGSAECGVIAIYCRNIKLKKPLMVYGDGDQIRDYVHVYDIVRANVLALDHILRKHKDNIPVVTCNISTGTQTSVNDILDIMRKKGTHMPERPGELRNSCLDPTWAGYVLGWKPKIKLANGIKDLLNVK